jgi:hypothetical protein
VTAPAGDVRARYDWRACAIGLVAAFAAAVPAGFLAARLTGSTMLLTVVVTGVGTLVSLDLRARRQARGTAPSGRLA